MTSSINIYHLWSRMSSYIKCLQAPIILVNTDQLIANVQMTSTIVSNPNAIIRSNGNNVRNITIIAQKFALKPQTGNRIKPELGHATLVPISTFLKSEPCIPIRIDRDVKSCIKT